jgi:serine protease Do
MKRNIVLAAAFGAVGFVGVMACNLRAHASPFDSGNGGGGGGGTVAAVAPPVAVPDASRSVGPLPSLAPLVKQLRPSVVNIYTTQNAKPRKVPHGRPQQRGQDDDMEEFFNRFFGGGGGGGGGQMTPQQQKRQALGSGFIIGDGLVLTNNHVIEGADLIKVKLADGREFDAKVVGRDESTDVGLVRLTGDTGSLQAVKLGDSDSAEVGDYVVAIGNPFGLSLTVTSGIVSAKERVIGAGPYDDFIQTDASINPGNSGGPLFNLKGEVIGINTAIVAQGQGIGFAVPINIVKDLLPQIREKGKVVRGWLGVGIQEITPELAHSFNIPSGKGALISQVFPGGPAAKAGIQGGDVVTAVNGKAVDSPGALSRAVAATAPGGKASITYTREGKPHTAEIVVAERDEASLAEGRTPGSGNDSGGGATDDSSSAVGLTVAPITPEIAERLGIQQGEGVVVTDVAEGSAAEAAGVQPNDVLVELQRRAVSSIQNYRQTAKNVKPGETVVFRIRRGGSALYLAAKAPKK